MKDAFIGSPLPQIDECLLIVESSSCVRRAVLIWKLGRSGADKILDIPPRASGSPAIR